MNINIVINVLTRINLRNVPIGICSEENDLYTHSKELLELCIGLESAGKRIVTRNELEKWSVNEDEVQDKILDFIFEDDGKNLEGDIEEAIEECLETI